MSSRICFHCMKMTDAGEFCAKCGKKHKQIPSHHLLPGTTLMNKYIVGYAMGEGGFGITYVGLDNSLQLKVAIKEFFPKNIVTRSNTTSNMVECLETGDTEALFQQEKSKVINEARILAKFSKEHGIVNVREYFESNNTAYIVMEFLEGETLEQFLSHSGSLNADKAFELLIPVMSVLEQLHKENVVHRDISPDNIMFDGHQLKLLDFGAAREMLYSTSKSFSVILKHGYAPEEQYRRKGNQGSWTDVYSLCATIYYCITNTIPDTSLDRMHEDELKKPSELGVQIAPYQEEALMRGLSVLPEARLKTIGDFIKAWNRESIACENSNRETVCDGENSKPEQKPSGAETVYGGQSGFESVDSKAREVEKITNDNSSRFESKNKSKKKTIVPAVISVAVILLVVVSVILIKCSNFSKITESTSVPLSEEYKYLIGRWETTEEYVDGISITVSDDAFYVEFMETGVCSFQFKFSDVEESNYIVENNIIKIDSIPGWNYEIVAEDRIKMTEAHGQDVFNILSKTTSNSENNSITTSPEDVLDKYLKDADSYAQNNQFIEAKATLDSAKEILGSDLRISEKKKEIEKAEILYNLSDFEAKEQYAEALKYINSLSELKNDEDVITKFNIFKPKYKEQVMIFAEEKFKTEGYVSAIDVLNDALKVLPEDEELKGEISEYESYEPIHLSKIKVTKGDDYSFSDAAYDPRDNIHSNVLTLDSYSANWSGYSGNPEFYVGKKYNRFICSIVPDKDFSTTSRAGSYLKVYADDKLIYTSKKITYKTTNIDVDLNISNVEYLRFAVENPSEADLHTANGTLLLVNPIVSK